MNITFEVPGKAQPKQRPRFNKWTGSIYTPKETVEYENRVRLSFNRIKPSGYKVIEKQAVLVEVIVHMKKSKSCKYIHPVIKIDLDNVIKSILDALNKVCYKDDKQVIGIVSTKKWGNEDKVIVKIQTVEMGV